MKDSIPDELSDIASDMRRQKYWCLIQIFADLNYSALREECSVEQEETLWNQINKRLKLLFRVSIYLSLVCLICFITTLSLGQISLSVTMTFFARFQNKQRRTMKQFT